MLALNGRMVQDRVVDVWDFEATCVILNGVNMWILKIFAALQHSASTNYEASLFHAHTLQFRAVDTFTQCSWGALPGPCFFACVPGICLDSKHADYLLEEHDGMLGQISS
jgi:hypothetical protein